MKCQDVSKELIAYLDRRSNSADRREIEDHLVACAGCRARAEEFRNLWTVLDEVPAVEPSFAFDARVRQRIAAELRRGWLRWLVPQPRLALSMALLLALSLWTAKFPAGSPDNSVATKAQDFEAIKDLGVLENYDVLTKFDALSELAPTTLQQPDKSQQDRQTDDGGGGS